MIEVEVRARLTEAEFGDLKKFLLENGEFVRHQDREMILLQDYAGYTDDFVGRDVDIRLRNTNGECEIMLKQKVSDVGRKEISLKLQDNDLENAKEIVKALGCPKGIWMKRVSDVYKYHDAEWAVVEAPPGIYYVEIEQEASDPSQVASVNENLAEEARKQGLKVLTDDETRDLIDQLGREVNKKIEL